MKRQKMKNTESSHSTMWNMKDDKCLRRLNQYSKLFKGFTWAHLSKQCECTRTSIKTRIERGIQLVSDKSRAFVLIDKTFFQNDDVTNKRVFSSFVEIPSEYRNVPFDMWRSDKLTPHHKVKEQKKNLWLGLFVYLRNFPNFKQISTALAICLSCICFSCAFFFSLSAFP